MWSSFIDQIQQRLDDAADLLGDEEGEEALAESNVHPTGGQSELAPVDSRTGPSAAPRSTIPAASTSIAPRASSVADVDDDDDKEGWDDEDLDGLVVVAPPAPSPPAVTCADPAELPIQPASTTAGASGATPAVVAPPATPSTAAGAQSPTPAVREARIQESPQRVQETVAEGWEDDEDEPVASVDTSNAPCTDAQEAPEMVGAVAVAESSGAASTLRTPEASSLLEQDKLTDGNGDSSLPPPAATSASEPTTAAAIGVADPAVEAPSVQEPKTRQDEEPEPSVNGSLSTVITGAAEERPSSSPRHTATEPLASASPQPQPPTPTPVPSSKAKEAGDVAQLLRFQQQLAEEMENVASLQKENSTLKGRLSALESELASASARLVKADGSEQQISLLIEKLGKEKERHKAAASERSELEEHVQDLEDELEEYRLREEQWIGGNEQQKQNESAAQQRIAQLEKEVRARDATAENLDGRLREATRQNGVLQHQVEELKATYSAQLSTVKESNSDVVEQLRDEVEQLRTSLQNLSSEYDTRTAELEREVQQSNVRAHQAEARFSEVEFGSVSTLQDLRNELEDSQRSTTAWKAESQKVRGEYTELLEQYALLKRTRASAEADLRERISCDAATIAELRKGLREWEERYQALQETLRAAHVESEDQARAIMLLEAANQKLKTVANDTFNRSQSDVSLSSLAPPRGSSLDVSYSSSPLVGRPAGRSAVAVVPMNPFTQRDRSSWDVSTDRRTRERLEQEVLRQSTELQQLRLVASESTEWKGKFVQLQAEHDLLLQLYGQLEDDVTALKRERAASSPTTAAPAGSPATPH